MGIDFYLRWDHMTKEETDAQFTGFATTGSGGYIREAYHGSPYATATFCPESWDGPVLLIGNVIPPDPEPVVDPDDEDGRAVISLDVRELRARLPAVKVACEERGAMYGEKDYAADHYLAFEQFTELAERKVAEGRRVTILNSY